MIILKTSEESLIHLIVPIHKFGILIKHTEVRLDQLTVAFVFPLVFLF